MTSANDSLSKLLSLSGKTALITGAANGIGRQSAERFAEAGAHLQLVDIDEAGLERAAEDLKESYSVHVTTHVVNLGDTEAIAQLWDSLRDLPDILVNNAAIFGPKKLKDIDNDTYEKTMNINTRSVVMMCREMIVRRGKSAGTIVNVSSIESIKAMTYDMLLYGASKAAVTAMSRALVKDYGKAGWKINTICPGGVSTPGARKVGIEAIKHLDFSFLQTSFKFSMRMPTKGIGQPDDIARAILWLATPMSDYINGAEIVVDGGFLAV